MEGSGSTGNPSAASSHKLPSDTDQHIFWPADWISAPGGAGGRSRESVTLLRSQDHQSSVEKTQEQAETLQSPRQNLQGQPENIQEAAEKPVENLDSPVESVQEPAATLQSSTGNLQEPAKTHQKTVENIHKPLEVPQNPLATLQCPAGEVDQLSLVQNHQYSPSEDFTIRAEQFKPHHPPPEEPEPGGSPPSTTLVPEDSLLTEPEQPPSIPDQTRQEALSPEQLEVEAPPRGCSPSALTGPPGPSSAGARRSSQHGEPAKDTPPPPLKALPAPPTADEQNHNIPSKDPAQQQAPPTLHLNGQQAPSTPHLDSQQAPLPAADQVLPSTFHQTGSTLDPLSQAPTLTVDGFSEQIQTRPLVSSTSEPKLCGFLLKQGGPLKTWKLRWFMHENRKNQLFYYRTPQDVMPLGRIELCSATFTYPLKAETGTFHIKTPERTFILKAVNQELMHYWLQQLQVKRWQHRQTLTSPDGTGNTSTGDNFLPMLKSPLGLVGEEAATTPTQRTPLANMSIKHPLIEFQNSVHSLWKRSSQEMSQSVFHVEAPPWTPSSGVDGTATASRTPAETIAPPPPTSLVEATGPVSLAEGRSSPSLLDGGSRKKRSSSSFSRQLLCRDAVSSPSERMSRLQQDKQMLMEEVKAQKELVWILHKALEASQLEKRTCTEFLAAAGEQERLELLRHGERRMADLQRRLEQEQVEAESLRRSLAQREAQLSELQEEVRRLTEKNDAKQEVIMKLSDQLANQQAAAPSCSDCQTFRQLQREAENLRDDMGAYRTQNRFLNSEIYQLTRLWRTSSEQEKSLMMKCAYLEASNCQVESRYLGVLRQLLETKSLDPVQRGAVQKMVEDALKRELKSAAKANTARDHDEYGFKIIPDYEVGDMKLLAKIQALEIRSHNLLLQEGGERPLLDRWAQYLAGRSDDDLGASPELKGLLRGGVPHEYRPRVWRWMVQTRTRTIREHYPECYQQLCRKIRTSPHPTSRQIELDLHRTLTTNQHFSSPSSPALQQLRRVLLAFSWRNPAIGYCQGLNRLAAIALLVLQSEEDAFWCLVAVVEAIMPQDYYTKNLVASQADQRVLKDFLSEKLPRLAAHFDEHAIDVSLITFNWFLVVFVESLPGDILLPLWDAFLYEGTKVIFRYALAVFKYKEDDILKICDSVEIYQYLRFFTKTISDGRRLIGIAFGDMNPFPRRLLRNRRALHLERLQGELRELEEQQKQFVTEHAEHKDKELDTMVSEDDEEL